MPCLFLLVLGQILVEAVEALFPERAVLRDPVGGRRQRLRIEATVVDATLAALLDEPGVLEDFQVLRYGGQRHVERRREIRDARFPERESREDGAARRVREGGKRPIERAGIVNHQVNNIARRRTLSTRLFSFDMLAPWGAGTGSFCSPPRTAAESVPASS